MRIVIYKLLNSQLICEVVEKNKTLFTFWPNTDGQTRKQNKQPGDWNDQLPAVKKQNKNLFLSDLSVLKYPLITPFILSLSEFSFTL